MEFVEIIGIGEIVQHGGDGSSIETGGQSVPFVVGARLEPITEVVAVTLRTISEEPVGWGITVVLAHETEEGSSVLGVDGL